MSGHIPGPPPVLGYPSSIGVSHIPPPEAPELAPELSPSSRLERMKALSLPDRDFANKRLNASGSVDTSEFEQAVALFQSEMAKACEFGSKTMEENRRLRAELRVGEERLHEAERVRKVERDSLESQLQDANMENTSYRRAQSELEEEVCSMRKERVQLQGDMKRVLQKNREMRDKLLRFVTKKHALKTRLDEVERTNKTLVRSKQRLQRQITRSARKHAKMQEEVALIAERLQASDVAQTRLKAEKKILTRKASESAIVDVLGESICRWNAADQVSARRSSIKPTKSAGDLKKIALLKNTIRTAYEGKTQHAEAARAEFRRLKVAHVKLRVDFDHMIRVMTEELRKAEFQVRLILHELKEEPTEGSGTKLPRRSSLSSVAQLKADPMLYAAVQSQVIEELGLLEFYSKKSLRPLKQGYLDVRGLYCRRWKRCFVVVSSHHFSLSLFSAEGAGATCLKRFSLHQARVAATKPPRVFEVAVPAEKTPLVCRAGGEKEAVVWVGFIRQFLKT